MLVLVLNEHSSIRLQNGGIAEHRELSSTRKSY